LLPLLGCLRQNRFLGTFEFVPESDFRLGGVLPVSNLATLRLEDVLTTLLFKETSFV
jgi:hypothetical protein